MTISIALAAGGTGGHLLPALAVADEIRTLRMDASVTVVGSTRHLDRDLLASRGVRAESTDAISFGSRSEIPKTLFRLLMTTRDSRRILSRVGAKAVCGFGGYPSLPPMLAASTMRLPRIAHEANALPRLGLANRIAARAGAEVWGGFDSTGTSCSRSVSNQGVPIRRDIALLDPSARREAARDHFGLESGTTVIAVVGGSLGAARINAAVAEMIPNLPIATQVIWSTGRDQFEELATRFASDANVKTFAYIEDMALAYAACDLVISRGGASTVAEIETVGRRALIVPLAMARFGEQEMNARALTRRGSAEILQESELSAQTLASRVELLLRQPQPKVDRRHVAAARLLAQRLIDLAEGS